MSRFLISVKWLTVLLFFTSNLSAQNHHLRHKSLDVLSYRFELDLNDSTDVISAVADIEMSFLKETDHFYLDLIYDSADQSGMRVQKVLENEKEIVFLQENDQLTLHIDRARKGEQRGYRITYRGIPKDGLIISENKFGDRTFFGDNWPNRGRHWLPTVDHPSDKARVEFVVHAPDHYGVVSVGTLKEESRKWGSCYIALAHQLSPVHQNDGCRA